MGWHVSWWKLLDMPLLSTPYGSLQVFQQSKLPPGAATDFHRPRLSDIMPPWLPSDYRQRYQLETSTNFWRQKKTLCGDSLGHILKMKKAVWDLWYHHLIGSINLHQDLPYFAHIVMIRANPSVCPCRRRRHVRTSKNTVLWDKMHTSMIMAFILERTA